MDKPSRPARRMERSDIAVRADRQRKQRATARAYSRDPEQRRIGADLQRAALRKGVL